MTTLGMTSHTTRSFDIEFLRPGSTEWKICDGTWSGPVNDPEAEEEARKALKEFREGDEEIRDGLKFRLVRTNSTITKVTEIVG